jgi:dethiobiotin synthetase
VPSRPDRLVAVLGTGTGVGKTWTAAAVLRALARDGAPAVARKPVQSFHPDDPSPDATVLGGAGGERPEDVCPRHRWYELPLAPPMAAHALGRPPFTVADLVAELAWPDGMEVGLVETVGGPRSPVAADGDSADLAAAMAPDLYLLVADAGLGAINAVRLSAAALGGVGTDRPPLVVFLNRFAGTDTDRRNRAWLSDEGFEIVTKVANLATRLRR